MTKTTTTTKIQKIKKSTLDCAIDWVRTHGWDAWGQFTEYEWHIATLVANYMDNGINYREAVHRAYADANI